MAAITLAWNWQYFSCNPPYSPLELFLMASVSLFVIAIWRLA